MSYDSAYDSCPWSRHYTTDYAASRVHGYANLARLVVDNARENRDQLAFTTVMPNGMSGSLRYGEVDGMSDTFAVYLREVLKVAPGTRVAVQMPNCLAFPVAALGVFKAGCTLVNVNPLYTASEMEHQFNDAGVEVVVIIDMFTDKLARIIDRTPVKHVVVTSVAQWFPAIVQRILKGVLKYWNKAVPELTIEATDIDDALEWGRQAQATGNVDCASYWRDLARGDTAVLQYTGGTTGVSKGSVLTHGNLLTNIAQIDSVASDYIEDGKECVLTALPLYHIFAFTVNMLAFHSRGARNVLVPSPRPIQNCQRAIENYPVTWISGVNTLFNALLNEEWFNIFPPKTMKVAIAGGTALHGAVADRWERVVGCPIAEGYGLTECSPVVSFNPIGKGSTRNSIGIPVPGTRVRIVDDAGRTVAPGLPGEIIVQGDQVMQGYWRRDDETAKTLKDGWLYTGDVAYMDEDGFFHIVDRKKDMVLVSGFNVYPNEVEDCIAQLDKVHEAAVIGVPDADTGEAVKAFVVKRDPSLTAEEVRTHCKQLLAAYKVPKQVEFRDELPKTPVGKVLRKELRAEAGGTASATPHGKDTRAA
ncbi:AMP-binding protein [Aquisalimonas sp.]|uniref:AMP-binding protein n=1 Tax=Aquisalimonas sp. TaxID=1872621 RepID=UPI0025BBB7C6|nr:AMP-binding protein [Aquisalimonas sp.]